MEVAWFSAGVSSAVACKLALSTFPELQIVYIDIDDHHPDNLRFINDCEKWFDREIIKLKSAYKSVNDVIKAFKYVNGPAGARCTMVLKKRVRQDFEYGKNITTYIWGYDCTPREIKRADRIKELLPDIKHIFPLIDNNFNKGKAHGLLASNNIKRPTMYDLGYPNNNCIGCVKGKKGYWNKIRKDFPNVFMERAILERQIKRSCITGCFLDELEENSGYSNFDVEIEDCGILCQLDKEEWKE